MESHVCTACRAEKPLTDFYTHHRWYCKECHKDKVKRYQKANVEKRRVVANRYYHNHAEKVQAAQAVYHSQPRVKESRVEKAKAYRKLTNEQRIRYKREWVARNPDRARAGYARDTQRRKARVAGVEIERFDRSEIFVRDSATCRYCGTALKPTKWHLDHIIPIVRGGTHTRANTVAACPKCNLVKHDKLLEELNWVLR